MKNKLKYLELKFILTKNNLINLLKFLSISMSVICICLLIYQFGFKINLHILNLLPKIYLFSLFIFFVILNKNIINNLKSKKLSTWRIISDVVFYILLLEVLLSNFLFENYINQHFPFLIIINNYILIYLLTFIYSILEISTTTIELIN